MPENGGQFNKPATHPNNIYMSKIEGCTDQVQRKAKLVKDLSEVSMLLEQ